MCERCLAADQIAKYQGQYIKVGGTFEELMADSIIYKNLSKDYSENEQQHLKQVLSNRKPPRFKMEEDHIIEGS
jgi:hypothetical protein